MKNSLEVESNTDRSSLGNALRIIQTCFNLLNHIFVSIVAVYMTFLCYNAGNQPVSWHAWLCCLGVSNVYFVYLHECRIIVIEMNAISHFNEKCI